MSNKEDKIMFKKYIEMKKKYLNLKSQIGGVERSTSAPAAAPRDKFLEFKKILQDKGKTYHSNWEQIKNGLVKSESESESEFLDMRTDEVDKEVVDYLKNNIDVIEKVIKEQQIKTSILEYAPKAFSSRLNLFKIMHEDCDISCVQEDDMFSLIFVEKKYFESNQIKNIGKTGLMGTLNIRGQIKGFVRQTKNIVDMPKVLLKNYYLPQGASDAPTLELEESHVLKKKGKATPANNISMGISNIKDNTAKDGLRKMGIPESAFGEDAYKAALFGDGVTIYYNTEKFKLSPIVLEESDKRIVASVSNVSVLSNVTLDAGCVTGFTESNNDPWVLAHFETKKNSNKFYVLSTHIESGRDKYEKEGKRIDAIKEILNFNLDIFGKSQMLIKDLKNLFICMDGNTVPYNDILQKYYRGKTEFMVDLLIELKPESCIQGIEFYNSRKPDEKDFKLKKNDQNKFVYSVNKRRGYGSMQSSKLGDAEYHLIDYLLIANKNNELVRHQYAQLPMTEPLDDDKIGEYVDQKHLIPYGYNTGTGEALKDDDNNYKLENLLKMSGDDKKKLRWFSDHLPVVCKVGFIGEPTFIVSQFNTLANGLAFDGFESPTPN